MSIPRVARTVNLGLLLGLALTVPCVDARVPSRTTGQWLLDLARDQGLRARTAPTEADLLYIETLLRAAIRVQPDLFEAHYLRFELAELRGDHEIARQELERLFLLDPGHDGVAARHMRMGLAGQQTTERRERFLLGIIGDTAQSAHTKALACVHLADIAARRFESERVEEWLSRATELEPDSPDAAMSRFESLAETATPEQRAATALALLRLNPLHVEAAWEVGLVCDRAGLVDAAGEFFTYALEVFRAGNPRAQVPSGNLLDLAHNLIARGLIEDATGAIQQAVAADPERVEAALLLHWLFTKQNRVEAASALRETLSTRFAKLHDPTRWPINEVAQAAWYYCHLDPQPHRALALAEAAATRAPRDPFVQRVLGWAQAANLDAPAALTTLEPLSGDDPYAAYQVVKLLRAAGEESRAEAVLREYDGRRIIGPALDLLNELRFGATTTMPTTAPTTLPTTQATTAPSPSPEEVPTTAPASPSAAALNKLLARFDRNVLEFHRNPSRFLQAAVRIDPPSLRPGEPWWVEIALKNRATFPITLGPDWAVNPVFVLSFKVEGDRQREYPDLLTVTLERKAVLKPGESMRLRQTIDIGPLRRIARYTPQQLQNFTVSAMLAPIRTPDGRWQPDVGGQVLKPAYFNRRPQPTSVDALNAIFGALSDTDNPSRFRAVAVVAELLGERQRAARGKLNYTPERIPFARMRRMLIGALQSESWELRARSLDALHVMGLDAQLLHVAEENLSHEHWLVRLMAMRLLARQGAGFSNGAAKLVADDEDELVRDLARSYLARWREAAPADKEPGATTPQP